MEALKTVLFVIVLLAGLLTAGLVVVGGGDGHWEHEGIARFPSRSGDVFDWLTGPSYRVKWIDGLVKSQGPAGGVVPGARIAEVIEIDGVRHARVLEVTEVDYGRVFAYRTTCDGVDYEVRYELSALNTARKTRVDFGVTAEYHGFWRKLIEPVLTHALRGRLDRDLDTLATMLADIP